MKRIVLISHSDTNGGAAIATYRLMNALREIGVEADLLVVEKCSNDPHVHLLSNAPMRKAAFLAERYGIWRNNGKNRDNLFKVSTADTGISVAHNRLVRRADAIILGWINQGTLSLREIRRLAGLGKPIAWTMHDLWNTTGICHHPYECANYTYNCGQCPFLGVKAGPEDLSYRMYNYKKEILADLPIHYVAVSRWVKRRAESSPLMQGKEVTVIHNPFPTKLFPLVPDKPPTPMTRKRFPRCMTMLAQRLDDPIKGLKYAIDALNIMVEKYPETSAGTVCVFAGEIRRPDPFRDLRFPHIVCGTQNDINVLQQLYTQSTAVLSTSLYETFGGTLVEGMSSGAVPVSFGHGGQTDIIDHLSTGYIANYLDVEDVADGIHWAFNAGISREMLHQTVVERFEATDIARRYLALLGLD